MRQLLRISSSNRIVQEQSGSSFELCFFKKGIAGLATTILSYTASVLYGTKQQLAATENPVYAAYKEYLKNNMNSESYYIHTLIIKKGGCCI